MRTVFSPGTSSALLLSVVLSNNLSFITEIYMLVFFVFLIILQDTFLSYHFMSLHYESGSGAQNDIKLKNPDSEPGS